MNTTKYKDISIFRGIKQWFDEKGNEYRAERDTWNAIWRIYIRSKNNDSFLYHTTIRAPKRASCDRLMNEL
jgi:hypothetical protein